MPLLKISSQNVDCVAIVRPISEGPADGFPIGLAFVLGVVPAHPGRVGQWGVSQPIRRRRFRGTNGKPELQRVLGSIARIDEHLEVLIKNSGMYFPRPREAFQVCMRSLGFLKGEIRD